MAARPRSHNLTVPNLYRKIDKRTGRVNFQYKDKRSGKFHGLGSDEKRAVAVAKELNSRIQESLVDHYSSLLNDSPAHISERGVTVDSFCERYMTTQKQRFEKDEISKHSIYQKQRAVKLFVAQCKGMGLKEVAVRDIVAILDEFTNSGRDNTAKQIRTQISDIFVEAQHKGEVDPGYNPAKATRAPKIIVKRARLLSDNFMTILDVAKESSPAYLSKAMMLALTTGLRAEDISSMKFSQIKDGHLFVATSKSKGKTKLAFPLELKNPLLDVTLDEILSSCRRTKVVSPYVIHISEAKGNNTVGASILGNTISRKFKDAREKSNVKWEKGANAPSFHEIRSLAERTYKEHGFNTQALLGHKSQVMTDTYHDLRGSDYTYIKVNG